MLAKILAFEYRKKANVVKAPQADHKRKYSTFLLCVSRGIRIEFGTILILSFNHHHGYTAN